MAREISWKYRLPYTLILVAQRRVAVIYYRHADLHCGAKLWFLFVWMFSITARSFRLGLPGMVLELYNYPLASNLGLAVVKLHAIKKVIMKVQLRHILVLRSTSVCYTPMVIQRIDIASRGAPAGNKGVIPDHCTATRESVAVANLTSIAISALRKHTKCKNITLVRYYCTPE